MLYIKYIINIIKCVYLSYAIDNVYYKIWLVLIKEEENIFSYLAMDLINYVNIIRNMIRIQIQIQFNR